MTEPTSITGPAGAVTPEPADLLVKGWYVVTMNPTRDVIRHGAVAIRDDRIVAVGKASDLEARYSPGRIIGRITYQKVCHGLAPSTWAASSSATGMASA